MADSRIAPPPFQIPAEYADFVSSSADLLQQFSHGTGDDDAADEVVYRIYLDDLLLHTTDVATQFALLSQLKHTIESLLEKDVRAYHWHRERFHLEVAYPLPAPLSSSTHKPTQKGRGSEEEPVLLHLQGVTHYGESLDDEWFLVYLLQTVSLSLPSLSIAVRDRDGEFLLVEACEHIDAWLAPENACNRVWIRQGALRVIPLDAPGRVSDGVALSAALHTLRDDVDMRLTLASPAVQGAIAQRTLRAFPAKARALAHRAACIVPQWVEVALSRNPALVSAAVNAFAAQDAGELSSCLTAIDLETLAKSSDSNYESDRETEGERGSKRDRERLVAAVLPMTRTLFAQLTFQPFKVPRKYHATQRRVAASSSSKAALALNVGLRVTAGLELAWRESAARRALCASSLRRECRDAIEDDLRARCFVDDETSARLASALLVSGVEYGAEEKHARFAALYGQVECDALCETLSYAWTVCGESESEKERDFAESDALAAQRISSGAVRGDAEDWLHLSPEQLDAEIESRTRRFAAENSAENNSDSDSNSDDNNKNNNNHVNSEAEQRADTERDTERDAAAGETQVDLAAQNEVERLQRIVSDFKSFLDEKSDFDGVASSSSTTTRKRERAIPAPQTTTSSTTMSAFDAASFDVQYLESVLASLDLRLDGAVVELVALSPRDGVAGVAEKIISPSAARTATCVEDEESIDSDDELDEDELQRARERKGQGEGDSEDDDEEDESDEDDDLDSWSGNDLDVDDDDKDAPWNAMHTQNESPRFDNNESEEEEEYEDDAEDAAEYSMEELQRAMDSQLFDERALANTFANMMKTAEDDETETRGLNDADVDTHFLMSMLEAHAEGLGVPSGPIHQILGQLGLSLPRPPPMDSAKAANSKTKR